MAEFIELTTIIGKPTLIRRDAILQVFQESESDPKFKTGGENGIVTKDGHITMVKEDYERIRQMLIR